MLLQNSASILRKSSPPPSCIFHPSVLFPTRPQSTLQNQTRFIFQSPIVGFFHSSQNWSDRLMIGNGKGQGLRLLSGIGLRWWNNHHHHHHHHHHHLGSMDYVRVSAVSDGGGSGGSGGGGGGGGGRGGEDGGGGGGDGKWSLLLWYLNLLEKFPVITKAVTSALLTFVGDLICQFFIDQAPSLDYKRTFVFTLLGLVLVGPTLHFWYLYLSRVVTVPGASGALLRLLLDQFLFSPLFIGVFLAALVTLEGKPAEVVPKLQQEWFSSVVANWQLWIPFQFLNFRFVPQQFQVLCANCVALIWNVILSFKAHKELLPKKDS